MYEIDINLIRFPDGTSITWPVVAVTFLAAGLAALYLRRDNSGVATRNSAARLTPLPRFSPTKERTPEWRVYAVINTETGVAEHIVLGWRRAKALSERRSGYITVRLA